MPLQPRDPSHFETLRGSRRLLAGMAPLVAVGLWLIGLLLFLNQVGDLFSDMQLTWGERRVVAIVGVLILGGFGLGGWVASRLIRALAELVDVLVDQSEAACRTANLIEWHVVPALGRLAVSLERAGAAPTADARGLAIAGVRQAIESHRWDQAERLIETFLRDYPEGGEGARLSEELAGSRQSRVDQLRAQLDAAKAAMDPERVVEFRDQLTQHMRGEPLKELDRELVRWLIGIVQRRMRTGTVRSDVAQLAARVADSFGDTVEGASLRAALPTIRRSAGLCPRCAQPYRGLGEACPACLGAAPKQVATSELSARSTQETAS